MQIRKTTLSELSEVMEVYAYARKFMAEHGNPNQWRNTKPTREQVEEDIRQGKHYVCEADGKIAAVFFFNIGNDPTYDIIYNGAWLNDRDYGVVHRIASAGIVKGAGSFCVNWAFAQCGNLKIDTHEDNIVMQNMLKKNGFSYCGIIHLENGDERLAFHKEEKDA